MRFAFLFLLSGFLASAQKPAKPSQSFVKPISITAKDNKISVTDIGKTYTYDFLMPKTIAVSNYFVKAEKDVFYIRYDYTASARSQSYYLVSYKWKNGKIYLWRFANLKNRIGKWSGTAHFYKDKSVTKWEQVQDLLSTRDAEDSNDGKNIGIYIDRKPKGKLELAGGIKGDRFIQKDDQFIALLNLARIKAGL